MPTQIAEAYVQIKPSVKGIKNELQSQMGGEVDGAGAAAGESFGSSMIGKLKGIIAAAGIGAIIKESLDAGGALQQSFGGLDTLYGEASEAAKQYAKEAVNAGISMNDYAEQAVSFGASLRAAFKGDTTKAVEAANTAIMDMADNAAKMGSPLESIQNAYQGFAKGQYNMLDNLKLGYSGSKTEMERLLKDAQKLSGQKYDLNNLGDVYAAIHVIQEDLGLTGVAAAEASETFTGSFEAMKAATTNLLADLSTGQDVSDDLWVLMNNAFTFVQNNMLPMIANILKEVPSILTQGIGVMIRSLNIAGNNADALVSQGVELVAELVNGVLMQIPYLVESGLKLIVAFGKAIINYDWVGLAQNFISEFTENMDIAAGEIFGSDYGLLDAIIEWINNTLPGMIDGGMDMLFSLIDGVIEGLPAFVDSAMVVLESFIQTIVTNLPQILETGLKLIMKFIEGLLKALPKLVDAAIYIIKSFGNTISKFDWKQIGINILEGIKNGILAGIDKVIDAAKQAAESIYNSIKDFFQIGSPSKLMASEVGKWIPAGIAVGIEANADSALEAMDNLSMSTVSAFDNSLFRSNYSIEPKSTSNDMGKLLDAVNARETNVVVTLEGDTRRFFKAMQSEARNYNTVTGRAAFS